MIDTETPLSRGWWFKTLAKELHNRRLGKYGSRHWNRQSLKPIRLRPPLLTLEDHFRGDPPLDTCTERFKEHFREILRQGRLNVAQLVVVAKANRMQLRAFRTQAANDELGDAEAQRLMRLNDLGLVARDVHEGFLSLADSYVIVTPPGDDRDYALATAEDATQVITAHDAATGKTLAGLKMFRDEWDDEDHAYVYLPGKVFPAKKKGTTGITDTSWRMSRSWEWDDDNEQDVPDDGMPVVRFRNRLGVGEFEPHLDTLDRLNRLITKGMVVAEIQAHKQLAVKGLPTHDEKGEEIDYDGVFEAAPGAFWEVPENTEFWESGPVDLTPIRMMVDDTLKHVAAVTSTPLHTVTPDAASGSAEGASLMREEHVYAVEDRRDRAERSWAQVMSMLLAWSGQQERSDVTQIEPIWGPIERHSLQEQADAVAKMAGKLPQERMWTDVMQYKPAEIPHLRAQQGRDLLLQPLPVPSPNGTRPTEPATEPTSA